MCYGFSGLKLKTNMITAKRTVKMNLFWFGKDSDKKDGDEMKQEKKIQAPSGMIGGTAIMMENLKQSQEIGKKIASLLSELSSSTIEGSAAQGKVKVFVDGQQQPIGVEIDKQYFSSITNVDDLNEALITAMQEAHNKSMQLMQEKIQTVYSEQLGIPPTR
jgi:DNA-binding protein YbaB